MNDRQPIGNHPRQISAYPFALGSVFYRDMKKYLIYGVANIHDIVT